MAVPQQRTSATEDDPSQTDSAVWAIVQRAQAGDTRAFGELYDRYVDTVYRFIHYRVGNRAIAEDLTSDVFLRVLKRINSFVWQGRDFGAWVITIARNITIDHFKSGRYRLEWLTDDAGSLVAPTPAHEDPSNVAASHMVNATLLAAVRLLNDEQRQCIVLRFFNGMSVAETATAMGKNEGAIKALQYRAVRTLHRLLPAGFEEKLAA